jgi:hypothetical protein
MHWQQEGHHNGSLGMIHFTSDSGLYSIKLTLEKHNGLYYCPTNVFAISPDPFCPDVNRIHHVAASSPPELPNVKCGHRNQSVSGSKLAESETWMLCLGSPGKEQLDLLPGNVTGVPSGFQYHPFWFLDLKEEARIQKQASQRLAERATEPQQHFYIDFGFMHASSSNYSWPNEKTDRVVLSYDRFSSCLLIVNGATRYIWCFLTKTKEPPTDLLDAFFSHFGHDLGGSICTDQGGKLAHSGALANLLLWKHRYITKPMGANSPSQNGAIKIYKGKLVVRT